MTRTIGAGLAAHIATGRTRLSRCLLLDLRDGSSLGITDHDRDLSVSLGDSPTALFRADIGVIPSAIALGLGLEADNYEVTGPLGDTVTRQAVLGGRYYRARARLFDVQWDNTSRYLRLLSGRVSEARVEGGSFTLEIRSAADAFNQTIGRVVTPYCSHDFGVGQCAATPTAWAASVTAVTDDLRFTVAWTGATPTAAQIRNGHAAFNTGELAGTLPIEVFELTGLVLELYQPLAAAPQVGDTLTVTEGCDKLRPTCKTKGQILNFGGFPDLVGTDSYVKFPNPGA